MKSNNNEITIDQRISQEYARLREIYSSLDDNKLRVLDPLIKNSAFMTIELEELQKVIIENGASEEYKNGENQYGRKASGDMQAYNAMVKNLACVQEKLIKQLPTGAATAKLELFRQQIDQVGES